MAKFFISIGVLLLNRTRIFSFFNIDDEQTSFPSNTLASMEGTTRQ